MRERTHLRAVPTETPDQRPTPAVGMEQADRDAYWAWANLHDNDPEQLRRFKAAYCGAYASAQAWALELVISMDVAPKLNGVVPDWFHQYVSIDLVGIARDFCEAGEIRILDNPHGGVWVFDARARSSPRLD